MDLESEKRRAGEAAARLVVDGMRVGLGTGSTVAYVLEALGAARPDAEFVATSPQTASIAQARGLRVATFDGPSSLGDLDLAIDGADQLSEDGWLVKGRGGAHTREKIVAAASREFVVVVDSSKLVASLHPPVPVELLDFGLASTLRKLQPISVRDAPHTPDGNVLADYLGQFDDPLELCAVFDGVPGVVGHGLFAPSLVTRVLVGHDDSDTTSTAGGAR